MYRWELLEFDQSGKKAWHFVNIEKITELSKTTFRKHVVKIVPGAIHFIVIPLDWRMSRPLHAMQFALAKGIELYFNISGRLWSLARQIVGLYLPRYSFAI